MKRDIVTVLSGVAFVAMVLTMALAQSDATPPQTWKKALPPYSFDFTRDHASHPDYRIEWWYYTGNLVASDGHRFGYQLTFFRVGVDFAPVNPSRWAVRDLYTAHFAVSDLDRDQFRHAEKLSRAGIGWAGAETKSYRVWNEDWEARQDDSGHHRLKAIEAGMAVDLDLAPGKRPIPQGENGVSQKGEAAGNASHYYSLTRMPTRGVIEIEGKRYEVSGTSWMDHEFGTSFLEPGQIGWDWMSIQLDDGTDLMLYQFRRTDGARDRHSNGTLVDINGESRRLSAEQFTLTPVDYWTSPTSGARYPIAWRIEIPDKAISMTARAAIRNQELETNESTRVTYWEGATVLEGTDGRPLGRGYLEMTGYAGAAMGAFKN